MEGRTGRTGRTEEKMVGRMEERMDLEQQE
jgi:hypothetical protein